MGIDKDNNFRFWNRFSRFFTATRVFVLGYLTIILIGTAALAMPFANVSGKSIGFIDAFFTATSATCVTGLVVVDTALNFTLFGQIVVLLLIQIGGLGFMTLSSAAYLLIGKKISLRNKIQLVAVTSESNMTDLRKLVKNIVIMTLTIEFFGAILLSSAFAEYFTPSRAMWYGLFHSVSSFCNAGFDIIPFPHASLDAFYSDPFILLTVAALVVIGGLGFMVLSDMFMRHQNRRFQLHTRVVLIMTPVLIVIGTLLYFWFEFSNADTLGAMNTGDKLLNAFFLSVSTRTAGYASFDLAGLSESSVVLSIILMFIGASPSSTGGGLKTTTLFVLAVAILSTVRQKKNVVTDMHKIGKATIAKAASVLMLAVTVMALSMLLLSATDGHNFSNEQLLFEQVSAYATCGLSLNVTPGLSVLGKLIIILNMFIGRIGVLTFFIAFSDRDSGNEGKIVYPEANIII